MPLPSEIKEQTKKLWKEVFQDSDTFIQLYFDFLYTEESNLYVLQHNKVVAALQVLSFFFQFKPTKKYPFGYISGLATLPVYRNRGFAGNLLQQAHKWQFVHKKIFSFLVPATHSLVNYYISKGYAPCAYQKKLLFEREINILSNDYYIKRIYRVGEELIDKIVKDNTKNILKHTKSHLMIAIKDYILAEQYPFVLYKGDKCLGVAFVQMFNNGVRLKYTTLKGIEKKILIALLQKEFGDIFDFQVYRTFTEKHFVYALWRVVRVKEALALMASLHPNFYMQFSYIDEEIEENTGCYSIKQGECNVVNFDTELPTYTPYELNVLLAEKIGGIIPTFLLD